MFTEIKATYARWQHCQRKPGRCLASGAAARKCAAASILDRKTPAVVLAIDSEVHTIMPSKVPARGSVRDGAGAAVETSDSIARHTQARVLRRQAVPATHTIANTVLLTFTTYQSDTADV